MMSIVRRELPSVDGDVFMELCLFDFLEDDEFMGQSEHVLRAVCSTQEHAKLCFDIFEAKIRASFYSFETCLKLLILLHHMLQHGKVAWVPMRPLLDTVCKNSHNQFVISYAKYLQAFSSGEISKSGKADEFLGQFSVLNQKIAALVACRPSSDCAHVLITAMVDMLVIDAYALYDILRSGMDKLKDAVMDPECPIHELACLQHSSAVKLMHSLTGFLRLSSKTAHAPDAKNRKLEEAGGSNQQDSDSYAGNSDFTKPILDMLARMDTKMEWLSGSLGRQISDVKENLKVVDNKVTKMQRTRSVYESGVVDVPALSKMKGTIKQYAQSLIDSRFSKTNAKLDRIGSHIGALHEKVCRTSLGRNIDYLVGLHADFGAFRAFESRLSSQFMAVQELCEHLQLTARECARIQARLLHELKSEDVGLKVLERFLQILIHELEGRFSLDRGRWPKFAVKIEDAKEEICELLAEPMLRIANINVQLRAIMCLGMSLKNMSLAEENLQSLFEHIEEVIQLLNLSQGPKNIREFDVLYARWGLLLLFWVLKGTFRHAVIEVDLRGSVVREKRKWKACIGEIKSSDGRAKEKAKKQMDFVAEVFEYLLKAADLPNYELEVTKFLFLVHNAQSKVMPIVQVEQDMIVVDASQLAY